MPISDTVEVVVGVIGRAHGIRGDVAVDLRTDEPDRRFAVGQQLRAEGTTTVFTVESARNHSGRLLVRFAGLADRTAVETVRGTVLVADVPADEQPSEDGEYFDRQLVGLAVRDLEGVTVGTLTAVLHLPMQDVLEITTPHGPRLVPFVSALVPQVDLTAGVVTVGDVAELLADDET
jgi:16S rRNA processing protein RimM